MKKKSNKETTISFVCPCYNDGNTIEKFVRSVKDQDLPGIEVIVVNDGSTDNSKVVLEGLKEEGLIDKLIHLDPNGGACKARNIGAKEAKGKYLSFLPADAVLYPGMARIWYDQLEANPDADFVYGGYRFITEEGENIAGADYFFQPFNPYLLEVTNYIDGSFPIKTESFWKYAKIMGQEDGLWDSNIKSLQDWDFWLSVVRNGGKGVYVREIFFGTTPPHKGGLSDDSANNWIERTETIKKKHGIPDRKICVGSLGAAFHAKRIAEILNADFKDMPSFKPHRYDSIYAIGFYPEFAIQQDQMFLNNVYKPQEGRTAAKKVVHFVGSDIWQLYNVSLRSLKFYQNYFKNNIDEVLCEADFTQNELKELGIDAKIVPIPPAKLFDLMPLPKEFTVACYMPMINADFYRPAEMAEIAKKMPDVKFKFFGNPKMVGQDTQLPNVEHMGYVNDMEKFIGDCSAIMRFPHHDGLPISVLEFILAGRYAVLNVPVKHSFFVPEMNSELIVKAITELRDMAAKGQNIEGANYWRAELDHNKYKETIENLCGYNPKEYWEKRAEGWTKQSKTMGIEVDDVKAAFEKLGAKSVLDIGCGDGRWYPYLKSWGVDKYYGIDISEKLIQVMKDTYPEIKDNLSAIKVEDYEAKDKVDVVFAYTCFEHIVEKDMPKAVEAVKKMGKKLMLIEPTNFDSRYYCHSHDYRKYFNVLEEIKLKDKVIMICEL